MSVVIEIYDENQQLLLSNSTMLLTTGLKELAGGYGTPGYEVWENFGGAYDPQTISGNNYEDTNFITRSQKLNYDSDSWFMPKDGSKVYSLGEGSFAVCGSNQFNIAYMKDDYPTSADQYLSIYDPNGNLLWSAAALLNCPIILEKINLKDLNQVVIDLTKYGKDINKLYINSTMVGSVSYGEFGLGGVTGIAAKRVGNTVYIGYYHQSGSSGVWGDTLKQPYYLYVAFIP
ncbi:hypothetical protein ACSVHN_04775 [Acinetobacter baumannii]|uniref:hypothetical protein n=1 Tax=Acinetobacter baumannii TaxID=470 RepID=UPI000BF791EE|nr:hypothetical protein [Acinetobacter baumannii]MDC4337360.1 hypothetical protein [Acinetobacter baumannii]MDC4398569.1 hypothetical protein [Acinetobacter baumannii]MDC4479962.1 hypothetical protein [Acinetobacter baumannii]MDC4518351.1 hypothetical protein [Acinetobacter baumannii]MDC4629355.1 hypothetical protein [Acinetobacter baumannii]